jgi:TolB-like protein
VAARTSSFQFKGEKRDISEIATRLKVRMVLEGSVRKQGERVRITAQLIDAHNGFQVWSQTFDRKLDDIFAIQDEIAGHRQNSVKIAARGGGCVG